MNLLPALTYFLPSIQCKSCLILHRPKARVRSLTIEADYEWLKQRKWTWECSAIHWKTSWSQNLAWLARTKVVNPGFPGFWCIIADVLCSALNSEILWCVYLGNWVFIPLQNNMVQQAFMWHYEKVKTTMTNEWVERILEIYIYSKLDAEDVEGTFLSQMPNSGNLCTYKQPIVSIERRDSSCCQLPRCLSLPLWIILKDLFVWLMEAC